MRYIKGFNESIQSTQKRDINDIYKSILSSIMDIRSVFIDFEDSGDIDYKIGGFNMNSNMNSEYIITLIRSSLITSRMNGSCGEGYNITITCSTKLSYKLDNQTLNDYSRDKYEDFVVCLKRLELMGYGCSLDIDKYLPQYSRLLIKVIIKEDKYI